MRVKEGLEKAFVLIILLKKLLTEPTFLSSQIEYLFVIELTSKLIGKQFGDNASTTAHLASNVNDYFLVVSHW